MKKLSAFLLSAAIILASSSNIFAQKTKIFSGIISYEINYEGFEPQQIANSPTQLTEMVKGNFIRRTENLGGGVFRHTIDVVDSVIYLLDLPIDKIAYSVPDSLFGLSKKIKIDIQKKDETKVICGFTCQKYDVIRSVEDDEEEEPRIDTIVVFTTDKIGINEDINRHYIPGLKGFCLRAEQPAGEGKKIVQEATKVKNKKISNTDFMMPINYRYLTLEQLQEYMKSLQGGGDDDL